ncbi:MAG: hypothetical protein U1E05_27455 [Patescibacteria group bacterium]|nr:hypothetical protein [Patescibacteria group bacterium]
MTIQSEPERGSPANLVAIAVAARRGGDRELERGALTSLEQRFGVKLRFLRDYWPTTGKDARQGEKEVDR